MAVTGGTPSPLAINGEHTTPARFIQCVRAEVSRAPRTDGLIRGVPSREAGRVGVDSEGRSLDAVNWPTHPLNVGMGSPGTALTG